MTKWARCEITVVQETMSHQIFQEKKLSIPQFLVFQKSVMSGPKIYLKGPLDLHVCGKAMLSSCNLNYLNTSLGQGNGLLFHGFMNSNLIPGIHLIKFINTTNSLNKTNKIHLNVKKRENFNIWLHGRGQKSYWLLVIYFNWIQK